MTALPPLLTVGYGSLPIAQFLELLHRHGVRYLLDIRSKPYSSFQPDYNRPVLQQCAQHARIRYVFMGDALGGLPDDRACYTDGKVDYEKVRARPEYQAAMARLRAAHEQGQQVALLCACGKPERCHRSKLVGVSLQRAGIPVMHLDDEGRVFEHEAVMQLLNATPDLFGFIRESASSRKRYLDE